MDKKKVYLKVYYSGINEVYDGFVNGERIYVWHTKREMINAIRGLEYIFQMIDVDFEYKIFD